ncbi:nucleotidyltransferase family protein [Thermosediminibacter litoriperuensis]|uniref:Putative nucleotidyltransferase n=1 Tax=Thermosediminibacter litoriperuensis TaxID=291989 RepID=A0A5S5AT94_9FIRM|nr:nucleotidyltransferase domain-containing protein [Thermosediminibacter litoriperuensis]TYP55489.1 putative nucleotidyltransferase [Thermosediminibacter litoriperuensis]
MAKTAKDMTFEELQIYKKFLRQRSMLEKEALKNRYEEAWNAAKKAAELLYTKFRAERVLVFGSLTDRSRFNKWSDIDIAVSGLVDELFFKAVAEVTSLDSKFKIDLIDLDNCAASLKERIDREGVLL